MIPSAPGRWIAGMALLRFGVGTVNRRTMANFAVGQPSAMF